MLRVTSGSAKNRKLKSPDIPEFRAVQEVAKLAIFSILGDKIKESECLDLYAGSGNLGIEALSRGANHCDFVDVDKKAIRTIEENLKKCKLLDKAEIHRQDAIKFVANTANTYDIIFLDPFYRNTSHVYLMELLTEIVKPEGIVFFLHGDNLDINKILKKSGLQVVDTHRYGKSYLSILKLTNEGKPHIFSQNSAS